MPTPLRKKLLLAGISCIAALVTLELFTAAWLHFIADESQFRRFASIDQLRSRYGEAFPRFERHRHLGFLPTKGFREANCRHNALGCRGPEIRDPKPPGSLRLLCLGGSTTYGWGVRHDDASTYPQLLQRVLREAGHDAEVVNMGVPGWTSLETLINFQTRGLALQPDWVLVYHAYNDVLARLVWPPSAYRPDLSGWFVRDGLEGEGPLWPHSNLLRVMAILGGSLPFSDVKQAAGTQAPTGLHLELLRQRRAGTYPEGLFRDHPAEQILASNPPRYFRENLRALLRSAAAQGIGVVLSTFVLSAKVPQHPLNGHPAIRAAVAEHNRIIRELAVEFACPLLDLATLFPDEAEYFSGDGLHFSAAGNIRRVQLLVEHAQVDLGKPR